MTTTKESCTQIEGKGKKNSMNFYLQKIELKHLVCWHLATQKTKL
jgi:hypothetical protein